MVTYIPETQAPRMPSQSETRIDLEQDVEDLPPFTPVPEPDFRWGEVGDGRSFACALNRTYDELLQWKRNLFKVPSGKAGKAFVQRMFNAYAEGSALECVATKAAMTMLALLLQKPSSRSKARENVIHLERRLKLLLEGKLDDLMHEGRTIQRQLTRSQQNNNNNDRTARLFAKLMMEGKVRAALRLVTQASGSGPLPLNNLANPNDPTSTQTVHTRETSTQAATQGFNHYQA